MLPDTLYLIPNCIAFCSVLHTPHTKTGSCCFERTRFASWNSIAISMQSLHPCHPCHPWRSLIKYCPFFGLKVCSKDYAWWRALSWTLYSYCRSSRYTRSWQTYKQWLCKMSSAICSSECQTIVWSSADHNNCGNILSISTAHQVQRRHFVALHVHLLIC